MQVTLGEEGSGFSKPHPLFLPLLAKNGDAWPPLRLPLRRRRLREVEREIEPSRARPGLRIDLENFMDDEDVKPEAKQMRSSLVEFMLPLRKWGLSKSIFFLFGLIFTAMFLALDECKVENGVRGGVLIYSVNGFFTWKLALMVRQKWVQTSNYQTRNRLE